MTPAAKDEMDLIFKACVRDSFVTLSPPPSEMAQYHPERLHEIFTQMENKEYLRKNGDRYVLTELGRIMADAGGIIAYERRIEENQRKSDTLLNATVRAHDSTIKTNADFQQVIAGILASNSISEKVGDSTLRMNCFMKWFTVVTTLILLAQAILMYLQWKSPSGNTECREKQRPTYFVPTVK